MPLTWTPGRTGGDMRAELPATFEAIEKLVAEFGHHSDCLVPRAKRFISELLFREALTNAVVHGSHVNPAMRIRCAVRMNAGRLIIAVEDEGPGFDWRAIQSHEADLCSCSGRGLEILRKYASRVRFNHKGNSVTLVKDFVNRIQPDGT